MSVRSDVEVTGSRAASTIVALYVWSTAIAGPLRYVTIVSGFPVHLLPKVLLFLAGIVPFLVLRATPRQFFIVFAIGAAALVALSHRLGAAQVAFGFWALVPFFYGMLFPRSILSDSVHRNFLSLLVVSVAGEFLSYVTVFPWAGMNMDVGGVSTMAAREWSSGSARRLAGFTTSSIDLSVTLAILGMFFVFRSKQFITRLSVFMLFAVLIFATTMKTAAAAFILACLPLLASSPFTRACAAVSGILCIALGSIVPFLLNSPAMTGVLTFVRTHSSLITLQERFDFTWAETMKYMHQVGSGVWGIGLGGLGAATAIGHQDFLFASVDSIYIYLIGEGGLLGILILVVFGRQLAKSGFTRDISPTNLRLPLLVFFAIYGVTQSLVETSISALFLGALLPDVGRRVAHYAKARVLGLRWSHPVEDPPDWRPQT